MQPLYLEVARYMLIKGIDLPEGLLRAHEAGELVVFAGAGVSCPAPASLPLFKGLAEMVGRDTPFRINENEPIDRYLGRLKQNRVRVHELAASILINDQTKPHELHRLLVELFGTPDRVKLVTTNFDTHFSSAITEKFSSGIETFFAPALPLGDDFTGLVYLHGCAKNPPKCVITDEDFGRAYLTQAWASRFLQGMFSRYAVLFVGYSHDDTVMNYLARGLPPERHNHRFAFTTEEPAALSKWNFLGIQPIKYQKSSNENEHEAITTTMREWVLENNRGILEKGLRIQSIVVARPPLEGEDADYIKQSLGVIETARIFFKHAAMPEWISWMEKHEFLQPIFSSRVELSQIQKETSFWFIEKFLDKHPQEIFAALVRNSGRMTSDLCWWLWRRLAVRDRQPVDDLVFKQSIAVLLAQPPNVLPYDNWAALLSSCKWPSDKYAALGLFSRLITPHVVAKKSWQSLLGREGGETLVDFETDLAHHDRQHSLAEAWQKILLPNLATCAYDLEPIILSNLTTASTLSTVSRPFSRNRDPFYPHRQSIYPHSQDSLRTGIDVLIDAARDILDYLLKSSPSAAAVRIEQWFASDIPILRRLAIFGTGQRTDVQPDEKLQWVEKNNLLFEFKTDIFVLLKSCYPDASQAARRRILDRVLQGRPTDSPVHLDEQGRNYEAFNMVVWLQRVAPQCELTANVLDRLRREHPEYGERQHPELNVWTSSGSYPRTAEEFDLDSIASEAPSTFLDQLLNWRPRNPMERDRESYCSAVSAITAKNPMWGIEWVQTLKARRLDDADLWRCVCQGWRNSNMDSQNWGSLLTFVETTSGPSTFFSAFADVLGNGARRDAYAIPDELMEQAQKVAVRIWDTALDSAPEAANSYHDWLTTAINNPGGKIAEFWLQRISLARKLAGDSWQELPTHISDGVRRILHSRSGSAAMARVYFTSQLHYFFSLDPTFTKNELIPLFNWEANELEAEQSWSGFLFWGRWLPGFKELLLPYFNKIITHKTVLSEDAQENLIHHIAGVAIFLMDDPLANEWLPKRLEELDEESRASLSEDFNRYLQDVETPVAETVWERWLKRYWKMRVLNVPVPLTPKEILPMANLTFNLGKHFPESLALIKELAGTIEFGHASIFHMVSKKMNQLQTYPDATVELVLVYLKSPQTFFYPDDEVTAVWKALCETTVLREKLTKVREAMIVRGHDPGEPPPLSS